jgi:hypothetical protein
MVVLAGRIYIYGRVFSWLAGDQKPFLRRVAGWMRIQADGLNSHPGRYNAGNIFDIVGFFCVEMGLFFLGQNFKTLPAWLCEFGAAP